ncbi:hypothetical protein [Paenibacillus elgii]|uniref:hypothetical protein n=1 Tax=Paenibacillus elgii TaxID=189691 RepID=UPI000248D268|nr:hypothetical protein [Paenibacillus elgii]
MTISEKNDRFTLIIDKELKMKIQNLADKEGRSASNFAVRLMDEYVIEEEMKLFRKYGPYDFYKHFHSKFGNNATPHPYTQSQIALAEEADEHADLE